MSKLKELVISLDPRVVVEPWMDNFDPYLVIVIPEGLRQTYDDLYKGLTDDEQTEFDDWESELLSELRQNGESYWKV